MKLLITGGAGYIGSVLAEYFSSKGFEIAVLDSLVRGHQTQVHPKAVFYQGDVGDRELVKKIFFENKIDAVIHAAGFISVSESVLKPDIYFDNNFTKPVVLLEEMLKAGTKVFLFSSTAAVYGSPKEIPIPENHPTEPVNPYGESKLKFENALADAQSQGLHYAALRYFNACGAAGNYGELHQPESHLIPLLIKFALGKIPEVTIFGTDYETEDGTCLRDYIHVSDLAEAHAILLEKLFQNSNSGEIAAGSLSDNAYNLGNGRGFTNKQIVAAIEKFSGKELAVKYGPRRAGDPAKLLASNDKISKLGWQPKHSSLENIISSAWKWHEKHGDEII